MAESSTVGLALSVALLAGLALNAALRWWWADAVAGLGMLPVILWQGWETLEDARMEAAQPDDGGRGRS